MRKTTSLYAWCKSNNKEYLLVEWNTVKNNGLTPKDITYQNNKKVWWKCEKGHEWGAIVCSRTGKSTTGCPYCSNRKVQQGYNDLATTHPQFIEEWDYDRNDDRTPYNITYGHHKRVHWKCKNGHIWEASLTHRLRGDGCPYCSGHRVIKGYNDLATIKPELLKDWDYEKNKILPDEVTSGSGKNVYWKCSKCDHQWKAPIAPRSSGRGCNKCSRSLFVSFGEKAVYYYVSKYLKHEIKENVKIPNTKRLEIDIYIPDMRVGIEFDGPLHNTERDKIKNKICKDNNIKLIRLRSWELLNLEDSSFDYTYSRGNNELTKTIKEMMSVEFKLDTIDIDVERDRSEIEELIQYVKLNNSIIKTHPEILAEWDYEKNKIRPDQVSRGTTKKAWWKCENGHSWYALISARLTRDKNGCPYCSNQRVLAGYNDLGTTHPELLDEWDYTKNTIKPSDVVAGTEKKAHWICSRGHRYITMIKSRKKGTGCPYCSGNKVLYGYNDLKTIHPDVLEDWDYEKNVIKPEEVLARSQKKVWWKCKECGLSWEKSIIQKTLHKRCHNYKNHKKKGDL